MPVVPIAEPTVKNQTGGMVPLSAAGATPDAFGAGIGQATSQLGAAAFKDAHDASQIATDFAIQTDTRAAKTADASNVTDVTNLGFTSLPDGPAGNKGFYSLQGQAAVDALPTYQKALNDSAKATGDNLPGERAQSMYNAQAQMRVADETKRAAIFANQQGIVADNQTSTARVASYSTNLLANYNDPTALANYQSVVRGEMSDAGRRNGWSADTTAANTTAALSKGYSDLIRTTAASGNVPLAAQQFNTLRGQMDAPAVTAVAEFMQPKVTGSVADAWVRQQMGVATPTPAAGDVSHAIRAQEGPGTSIQGANEGIMPTTFAQYAKPGESLDNPTDRQAVHDRIINDLSQKAGGDPARIAVGYFSGPGNMSPPGSAQPFIADKADANGMTTSRYVAGVLGRMASPSVAGASDAPTAPAGNASDANMSTYPDFASMHARAVTQFSGDHQTLQAVQSRLAAAQSAYELQTQASRDRLSKTADDTMHALEAGDDTATIPEAEIRQDYRPAVADYMVGKMQEARTAGQVFAGMRDATPDQIASSRDTLAQGLGPMAALSRLRGKTVTPPAPDDGTTPATDPAAMDTAHFAQRQKDLAMFDAANARRQKMITDDPVAYAQQNATVSSAYKAINPQDPATVQAAIQASQSYQKNVGVADSDLRTLPNATVAALVKTLHTVDPEKGDMGGALDKMSQQYGAAWPGVMKDLVTVGKLSPAYQTLASMTAPGQEGPRADLQRALQIQATKGDKFSSSIPDGQEAPLKAGVDNYLSDFRATTKYGGTELMDSTVKPAVSALATYYASQGQDGDTAAKNAAQAIIGAKYDLGGGTFRVPKGPGMPSSGEVSSAGLGITGALTDAGMAPGVTAAQARNGIWATNPDGRGVTLMATKQGAYNVVKTSDGKPVSMQFNALPKPGLGPLTGSVAAGATF